MTVDTARPRIGWCRQFTLYAVQPPIILTVALMRPDGQSAIHVECADPATWTEQQAREFTYDLQRLVGPPVLRQGVAVNEATGGGVIIVAGPDGTVVTPRLRLSQVARTWLERAAFEVPFQE